MDAHGKTAAGPVSRPQLWLLTVIAVVLVGWALHVMAVVVIPIVCSIFIALLVYPVDRWVAHRVPDRTSWLGHVAAVSLVLLVIGLFFGSIWFAAERVQERFPETFPDIDDVIEAQAAQLAQETQASAGEPALEPGDDRSEQADTAGSGLSALLAPFRRALDEMQRLVGGYGLQFARTLLEFAGTIFAGLILIFFLTLLLLVEQRRWLSKIETLHGSATGRWLQPIGTVAAKIRRYFLARTLLGVLTAALYTLWLWIFGVDLLVVWALLTFALNYIPNLGSLVSGALPVLYAFLTRDPQTALLVAAGLLVIEQVVGNYIDPRVQGRQVSVSPYLVLVLLLVWGWIWGVAGAVLAVPITVTALVFFAHVPELRPIALLLSRERDMQGLAEATGAR